MYGSAGLRHSLKVQAAALGPAPDLHAWGGLERCADAFAARWTACSLMVILDSFQRSGPGLQTLLFMVKRW